jgi:hypothetical protein
MRVYDDFVEPIIKNAWQVTFLVIWL